VPGVDGSPETLARGDGVLGELALRRRVEFDGQAVFELIVNGTFLMDTALTSTETQLADAVLDRHAAPRRVLVGGLGLGVTARAVLADVRVEQLVIVEIEPLLVDWLRSGLVPGAQLILQDPRVEIRTADVIDVLRRAADRSFEAVVLDVDNGPGFLVHPQNAALYGRVAMTDAARVLTPDGVVAIWSADRWPELGRMLATVFGHHEEITQTVFRDEREITYQIYLATLAPAPPRADDVRHG
jgi:spermidine synthase